MFTNGIVNVLLNWLSRIIHFEKFDENLWCLNYLLGT